MEAQLAVKHFSALDWENKKCVLIVERDAQLAVLQDIVCRHTAGAISVYSQHYNEIYVDSELNIYASTGYLINATTELAYDFVKRSLAHSMYLSNNTAFISGDDKYRYREVKKENNMLIPAEIITNKVLTAYVI